MKTYYLYRHVRKDTNEVFYVGTGTYNPNGKTFKSKYKRAHDKSKSNRANLHWQNIRKITDYEIEILFQCNNFDLINKKEIEFIKLYGRKDLNEGTLCNWDDGGRTHKRTKITDEIRLKMRENSFMKGRYGKLHGRSKPVYVYDINGNFIKHFESQRIAGRELKIDPANIKQIISGKCQQCYGMVFKSEFLGNLIPPTIIINKKIKKIASYNKDGLLIKEYPSITKAALDMQTSTSHISRAAKNNKFTCHGLYWKYI